jgi:hypothetical protein
LGIIMANRNPDTNITNSLSSARVYVALTNVNVWQKPTVSIFTMASTRGGHYSNA